MNIKIMRMEEIRRQSLISFTWQIMLALIGFVSTMYFAHTLGAKFLGSYFLILTYFNIINMISDGGLGTAAIKRISEGEDPNQYLTAFFAIRFLFLVITIIILLTFKHYFANLNDSGLFYWLIFLLLLSIAGFIGIGNAGNGKIGIHSTCTFIGEVSKLIVQIIAVFIGFGLSGLIGGIAVSIIVSSLLEFRFFDLYFKRFKKKHIKTLITFSFWLFLTSSGVLIYTNSDTILIGHFLGNTDVGIYRVVFQFSAIGLFISGSLISTLWPKISRWGKVKDFISIENSLSRALSFSLLLAIPILIGGIILGDKLLYFFYGKEFVKGYGTLIVMLFVQVISIFQIFYLNYLGALDHQKDAFKVTSMAAIINIVLNYILIPIIGLIGAATATLITITFNAVLAHHYLSKIISIRLERNSLLNILKSSIIMAIFVLIYRTYGLNGFYGVLIPVFIGGLIFIFLILKFDNTIKKEVKNIIISIF